MLDHEKYTNLLSYLTALERAIVAFSGGVDSTFLLFVAKQALADNVLAVTLATPYVAQWELEQAQAFTEQHQIRHITLELPTPENIKDNPPQRCYLCKQALFTQLLTLATAKGYEHVLEGTNLDDLNDYRPGFRALQELNIRSPLLVNRFTKADIRYFSRQFNLPTWNKPAYACLLTRLPHNTPIDPQLLSQIEQAEKYLMNLGFKTVRVRCHGRLARIEVAKTERQRLLTEPLSEHILMTLKQLGFDYVTVDLQGYQLGSFNLTTP